LTSVAWRRAGIVAVTVIAADQVTKAIVRGSLAPGAERRVLPGVLWFVRATNSGVAFNIFSGSAVAVTLIALVVLAVLVWFFAKHATQRLLWLPTGMIAGGAVGNLIDRLRVGAVTDFIKLPDWPAFNLADSAITLGVVLLVLLIGRGGTARTA
jgi:signal peptidase II